MPCACALCRYRFGPVPSQARFKVPGRDPDSSKCPNDENVNLHDMKVVWSYLLSISC